MYKTEFRDFDSTLPELEGFIDDSWHNDSCPSMYNEEKSFKLFVDYESTELKAYDMPRYNLYFDQNDGYEPIHLLSTDSLEELKEFLDRC